MKVPRILIITEYPKFKPTAMVRAIQFQPLFEGDRDVQVEYKVYRLYYVERIFFFIDRNTGSHLYRFYLPILDWISRMNEKWILRKAAEYDVVYIVRVRSITLYRSLVRLGRPKIVTDFGDALWLPCHQSWGWRDMQEMLKLSALILCENRCVEDYAKTLNPNTCVVEDAPQVEDFDAYRSQVQRNPAKIVIGWVGTSSTACFLYAIWEVLEELFKKYPQLELRIVGALADHCPRWEYVRASYHFLYTQEVMIRETLAMDIGIFPHFDVVDAYARGTLKAKIYMAGEVATICQNIGENPNLIVDGYNGLLAKDRAEWMAKLELLINNQQKRQELAANGLKTVREQFSRQATYERLKSALTSCVG